MHIYPKINKILAIAALLLITLLGTGCHFSKSPPPKESDLSLEKNEKAVPTNTSTLPLNTCQMDSDCVLAIRIDVCCSCPEVTTQAQVQATKGLEIYIPGNNYGSLRPAKCAQVDCPACPPPPAGPICQSGRCQAPKSVQEILKVCPTCYVQAAQAAYQSGNLQQAIDFCTRAMPEQQYICFSDLFKAALTINRLDEAEQLCRQHLSQDVGICLPPIAQKWANSDEEYAITLCNELNPADARHFGCILDIALVLQSQNQNRALEICAQLSPNDAELCRQEILK